MDSPKIEIISHRSMKDNRFKKLLSKKNLIYLSVFAVIIATAIYGGKISEQKKNDSFLAKQSDRVLDNTAGGTNSIKTSTVDEVTESKVVASLAENANLAVAPSTVNSSISLSILSDSKISDTSGPVEKPKVLEVSAEKREIVTYKVESEQSIQSIADKYGITAQTIKWVNNLKGDNVEAGKELRILPVDGIIYKIKENEKIDGIATKYQASVERIVSYNRLKNETDTKAGTEIVIPGGVLPEEERPDYVRPVVNRRYQTTSAPRSTFSSPSALASNFNAKAGNAYAYGYCTWYVYNRRPDIGSYWGNATSWAAAARAAGFTVVQGVPKAGSIFQYGGGYGHVGIVESVNESAGTMRISDMNGIAGWGVVGYKDNVPINRAWYYIY